MIKHQSVKGHNGSSDSHYRGIKSQWSGAALSLRGWRVWAVVLLLASSLGIQKAVAQETSAAAARLSRGLFKNGEETLRPFQSISRATRDSVVKLDLNGTTIALAAVIDTNGLALTKASEISPGKLTGWLASGREVDVKLIRLDEKNDLALVKVDAAGLKPVQWASGELFVGQWVVTPGIAPTPQAIGIISVRRRKILPKRALLGVQLDIRTHSTQIAQVMEGLGAAKAGLKVGDRIMAVNDSPVKEREELLKALRPFREGQSVKLRVQREQEEFDASVKLAALKSQGGGRGFDREDRMNRMGSEISERGEDFELAIQHDTVLQAWQCGGPLMNLDGKAVGLNIARAGRVASYALPADLLQRAIMKLRAESEL